jgi:hypothetical protein
MSSQKRKCGDEQIKKDDWRLSADCKETFKTRKKLKDSEYGTKVVWTLGPEQSIGMGPVIVG